MVELTERTRSRWLWLLAAVTAAYGLANVVVFFTTEGFGAVWFAASVLVYSLLLVSAVALSLLDPGRPAAEADASEERAQAGPTPISLTTVYETSTGRVLRARFDRDGTQRSLLFAISGDEVLPATAIEDRLREVSSPGTPIGDVGEVEEAVARRARQPSPAGAEDPGSVEVDLRDREVLHRSENGQIMRARYRAGSREYVNLFAVTGDAVTPVEAIEGDLDELRVDEVPVEAETVFEELLAREAERDEESEREAAVIRP